jgi:hypothetical protein
MFEDDNNYSYRSYGFFFLNDLKMEVAFGMYYSKFNRCYLDETINKYEYYEGNYFINNNEYDLMIYKYNNYSNNLENDYNDEDEED